MANLRIPKFRTMPADRGPDHDTGNFFRSIIDKLSFPARIPDSEYSQLIPDRPDETGWDRLRQAWQSFNRAEGSLEGKTIVNGFCYGALCGFCLGAFSQNREVFRRFIETHNTNVFQNKHKANRQLIDTMYLELIKRSVNHAVRYGMFSGTFVTVMTVAATYRNDIYYRDCALAGAVTGSLWKSHLGMRAILVNATVGSLFGLAFAGIMRAILNLSGTSVKELRYFEQCTFGEEERKIYSNEMPPIGFQ